MVGKNKEFGDLNKFVVVEKQINTNDVYNV